MLLAESDTRIPNMVPIRFEEILLHQAEYPFCKETRVRTAKGYTVPISQVQDDILFRYANRNKKICVPDTTIERVLYDSHHGEMTAHPGRSRQYTYRKRSFYWPSMAVDCYKVPSNCTTCTRDRFLLRKHQKMMQLFPAAALLEFVAFDIFGELNMTPRGNHCRLVIIDRLSKMLRTAPVRTNTSATVARAFLTH